MLIVAFDGLLFDTIERRAIAIADALNAEGLPATVDAALRALPSRSINEAVRMLMQRFAADRCDLDETTVDVATLRAERALASTAVRGATLNMKVADRIRHAATTTRIVVRADSRRREVDELLRLTELDSVIAMTRCSDDAANVHRSEASDSTLRKSYGQIVTRLAANRNLLGNASGIGVALEVSPDARTVAREFGFQAPDTW